MMRKIVSFTTAALLSSLLTGCGVHGYYPFLYHPTIKQGNIINPAAFQELRPGMNKAEVVNLVGEPVLETPLSYNVWHYVYTLRVKNKPAQRQEVTLYFSGNSLVQVVGP